MHMVAAAASRLTLTHKGKRRKNPAKNNDVQML
jgi:hypothetical protein